MWTQNIIENSANDNGINDIYRTIGKAKDVLKKIQFLQPVISDLYGSDDTQKMIENFEWSIENTELLVKSNCNVDVPKFKKLVSDFEDIASKIQAYKVIWGN